MVSFFLTCFVIIIISFKFNRLYSSLDCPNFERFARKFPKLGGAAPASPGGKPMHVIWQHVFWVTSEYKVQNMTWYGYGPSRNLFALAFMLTSPCWRDPKRSKQLSTAATYIKLSVSVVLTSRKIKPCSLYFTADSYLFWLISLL